MIRSSLCDYSYEYILVKGTITLESTAAEGADPNNGHKKLIFKICPPFTNCIREITNKEIDHAKKIVVVIPMCNLIWKFMTVTIKMNHL